MELLVVILIMGMISGLIISDYAGRRASRDLRLAQSLLVTNMRKIQSYSLSARNAYGSTPAQYYVLRFDSASSTEYRLQAIVDANVGTPKAVDVEIVNFPRGVRLAATNPIVVNRVVGASSVSPACAIAAYRLPYSRTYVSEGCSVGVQQADRSYPLGSGDDYRKVVDFVSNTVGGTVSVDADITVNLTDETGTLHRSVTLAGATGVISAQPSN